MAIVSSKTISLSQEIFFVNQNDNHAYYDWFKSIKELGYSIERLWFGWEKLHEELFNCLCLYITPVVNLCHAMEHRWFILLRMIFILYGDAKLIFHFILCLVARNHFYGRLGFVEAFYHQSLCITEPLYMSKNPHPWFILEHVDLSSVGPDLSRPTFLGQYFEMGTVCDK